jgi:hypothetical protein
VAQYNAGFAGYYWPWDVSNDGSVPGSWSFVPMSISEDVLKEDCLERVRQLKADMLLNLIEANQIWPSIKSITLSLPKLAANWYNLRKVLKTASDGYLAWKFGISPLLSDMMAVHRHLPKIRQDMDRHVKQAPIRASRVAELAARHQPSPQYSNVDYAGNVIKAPTVRYVLVAKPSVKYTIPAMQSIDYFMSRFATSPASLAWELVPFSFVVDWFVDLRGVLRKIDDAVGFSPFTIKSFTRSFSYHLESSWQARFYSPCNPAAVIQVYPRGTVEFKHYDRSLVSAPGFLPSWKPRFGKSQAAISAALISQMLSKANWVRNVSKVVRVR